MNPFEAFGLDPSLGLSEITSILRTRLEDARTEDERQALRSAWEQLTRSPDDRFRWALLTPPTSGDLLLDPPDEPVGGSFSIDLIQEIDFINTTSE